MFHTQHTTTCGEADDLLLFGAYLSNSEGS